MRVSGVSGVSPSVKPMNTGACGNASQLTPKKFNGVSGVNIGSNSKYTATTATDGHRDTNKCQKVGVFHKANECEGPSSSLTPLTRLTPQKHNKSANKADMVEAQLLFRFDIFQQEIEAGYPVCELRRINIIAGQLIAMRGFRFDEAIATALKSVVGNDPHQAETAFNYLIALLMTR